MSLPFLPFLLLAPLPTRAHPPPPPPPPPSPARGKATATLDGTWQFHTGDAPSWPSPTLGDCAWVGIQTDKSWGDQQHFNYNAHAWYRRHTSINPATDTNHDLSNLVRHIDDLYEIY